MRLGLLGAHSGMFSQADRRTHDHATISSAFRSLGGDCKLSSRQMGPYMIAIHLNSAPAKPIIILYYTTNRSCTLAAICQLE